MPPYSVSRALQAPLRQVGVKVQVLRLTRPTRVPKPRVAVTRPVAVKSPDTRAADSASGAGFRITNRRTGPSTRPSGSPNDEIRWACQ